MKKIIICVLLSIITLVAKAGPKMCAQDGAVVIPYGSAVQSANTWPNSANSGSTWTISTQYGNVMGISACLPSSYSTSSATQNTSVEAVGGETAGSYCWCRMLHPVKSWWFYSGNYTMNVYLTTGYYGTSYYTCSSSTTFGTADDCLKKCAWSCASEIKCNNKVGVMLSNL